MSFSAFIIQILCFLYFRTNLVYSSQQWQFIISCNCYLFNVFCHTFCACGGDPVKKWSLGLFGICYSCHSIFFQGIMFFLISASVKGCERERGWNQQIMMIENGRFYHSMYLGIL